MHNHHIWWFVPQKKYRFFRFFTLRAVLQSVFLLFDGFLFFTAKAQSAQRIMPSALPTAFTFFSASFASLR